MVEAVRKGRSMRSVAARFAVSLNTVQRWVSHAAGQRLDRVDWSGSRGGRRDGQATSSEMESVIVDLRKELRDSSDLGEFGAAAILRELIKRQKKLRLKRVPSLRTIGRILERRGVLDGRRRMRFPSPPKGWYLPDVREQRAELDSFDIVEGLVIKGGTNVEVLNGISLLGGLPGSWVGSRSTAKSTVKTLIAHWRAHGFPDYAQFDNDTVFQGAHQFPDSFGRVTRLCLQLGVAVVFAPPRETGFQASIESYNGRWQEKVWQRFQHTSLQSLRTRSNAYVAACRERSACRIESAPRRREIPDGWTLDLTRPLEGTVIFIRRTNDKGHVQLLGHDYHVSDSWCHRLVRCNVDLTAGRIRIYRLRRREPTRQPLLKTFAYKTPTKRFQGDLF
jgi:transposase